VHTFATTKFANAFDVGTVRETQTHDKHGLNCPGSLSLTFEISNIDVIGLICVPDLSMVYCRTLGHKYHIFIVHLVCCVFASCCPCPTNSRPSSF
jgi:hypothetical protein